jgi:hypothetical protein
VAVESLGQSLMMMQAKSSVTMPSTLMMKKDGKKNIKKK